LSSYWYALNIRIPGYQIHILAEFPPPLRREDAITPSTSSKHDLDSTEVESDENEPPKKKKKKK